MNARSAPLELGPERHLAHRTWGVPGRVPRRAQSIDADPASNPQRITNLWARRLVTISAV